MNRELKRNKLNMAKEGVQKFEKHASLQTEKSMSFEVI